MESRVLVRRERHPGDKIPPGRTPLGEYANEGTGWDYPPPYFEPLSAREKRRRLRVYKNKSEHEQVEPNVLNELCGRWDIGDLKTWLIILMMFLLGLGIAMTAYVMPHGRDTYVPPVKVY